MGDNKKIIIPLKETKERKAEIETLAESLGENVSQFIRASIEDREARIKLKKKFWGKST